MFRKIPKIMIMYYLFLVLPYISVNCSKNIENYKYENFISIDKLYEIPLDGGSKYFISEVRQMNVDDKGNLHVLSFNECNITVFDDTGKYLRTVGSKGKGPHELERPMCFYIYDKKYYIFELSKGLKIWDENGDYLKHIYSKKIFGLDTLVKPFNGFFICYYSAYLRNSGNAAIQYNIGRYDENLEFLNDIFSLKVKTSNNPEFAVDYIANDSDSNIYTPINRNKYIINKYDISGNLISVIGRKNFKREKYPEEYRKWYNKKYEKLIKSSNAAELPEYTPVISHIIVDDKDLIWVITGLFNTNTTPGAITSTIDIFNKKGEFIYSFECPYFNFKSIIKNNRLYSKPLTVENQAISVYNTVYNYPEQEKE